jgi:hypothetical protein
MAHYAKIEDGIVTNVIVADEDHINYLKLQDPTAQWIQTSYNTRGGVHYDPQTGLPSADQTKALRKNYAGIGFTYDSVLDVFIPPKPYPSWILYSQTAQWAPPIPMPIDGNMYMWNDDQQNWIVVGPPKQKAV